MRRLRWVRATILATIFSVAGACVSDSPRRGTAQTTSEPLRIFYTFAQHLQTKPCGCSFRPLGGVDRLASAFRKLKREPGDGLFLASGPGFIPWGETIGDLAPRIAQSEALVDSWNRLGLAATSVAGEDLRLGFPALKALEKRSRFPWLAANLYRKGEKAPLFTPFLRLRKQNLDIVVIGVAAANEGVPDEYEVRPPAEAVDAVVRSLATPPGLVIVLASYVSADERRALLEGSGPARMLFTGDDSDAVGSAVAQYDFRTLFLRTLNRGRTLLTVTLDASQPVQEFFHPELAFASASAVGPTRDRLAIVQGELKRAKNGQARTKLQAEIRTLEQSVGRAQLIPFTPSKASSVVGYDVLLLDAAIELTAK